MKTYLIPFTLALVLAGLPAQAACFADYKAKRDNPLRLHYGVIELPDAFCENRNKAEAEVEKRLSAHDWTLLRLQKIFGADGLEEREKSAGNFYLRF